MVHFFHRKNAPFLFSTRIGTRPLRQPLHDINGQPKVFHRSLLACVVKPPKDLSFDLYVLYVALRSGWRIETIPVRFERRRHGRSSWAVGVRSRWRHIGAAVRYMLRLRGDSAA